MRKYFRNKLSSNIIMSSRSLAAARARRAGENSPPVSGNRPITSIGSQAAFAQQMPSHMSYNMPPPPNNVRTSRAMQQPQQSQQQYNKQPTHQYYDQQQQQQTNGMPFSKLSISDAIGLITLRLGRVEQWVIETDHENENNPKNSIDSGSIPDGHKVIDNSVLTTIVNRLDLLEKNGSSTSSEDIRKLTEDVKTLNEQFKRMSEDVNRHNIELAKNTEQVFRFNRELVETKDILKSFIVKYDLFASETIQNFTDYEVALGELEKRLPNETEVECKNIHDIQTDHNDSSLNDIDVVSTFDLKNEIKLELANI